ncbi:Adenylosuccinate synthetase-domain-containing protein [Mycena latifolia]|nr:Adenylosuccinate synthetase-domain-containing protein [Mycena latifolia]
MDPPKRGGSRTAKLACWSSSNASSSSEIPLPSLMALTGRADTASGATRARASSSKFSLLTLRAGHTVVAVNGVCTTFAFNQLSLSLLVHPTCTELIANGVVVHVSSFFDELDALQAQGLDCTGCLCVSDRAHLIFDFHQIVDGLKEVELGGSSIDTTKKGIGPAYSGKDWTLVLDVCDHASANESNAKGAVRALRREFKYGEPAAQLLLPGYLWAIMLRNSSDIFISQSTSRKFLDTPEDLLTSSRTSPVVRERVMDVLAAAAYTSGTNASCCLLSLHLDFAQNKTRAFVASGGESSRETNPRKACPSTQKTPCSTPAFRRPCIRVRLRHEQRECARRPHRHLPRCDAHRARHTAHHQATKRKTSENRAPDGTKISGKDRNRECKIGVGNATLLNQALAMATPEDLENTLITEFHGLAGAHLHTDPMGVGRGGAQPGRGGPRGARARKGAGAHAQDKNSAKHSQHHAEWECREEELFAELLVANAELVGALKLYDDLKREAEDRSRKEVRMDPRVHIRLAFLLWGLLTCGAATATHSGGRDATRRRSGGRRQLVTLALAVAQARARAAPAAEPSAGHQYHRGLDVPGPRTGRPTDAVAADTCTAVSRAACPRLPGANMSRTPSPAHPDVAAELANGLVGMRVGVRASTLRRAGADLSTLRRDQDPYPSDSDDERQGAGQAQGRRRDDRREPLEDDLGLGLKDNLDDRPMADSEEEDTPERLWQHLHHPVQHLVYDAPAEWTQQRIREGTSAFG